MQISSRRSAQLGLGAACLLLAGSLTVLVAHATSSSYGRRPADSAPQFRLSDLDGEIVTLSSLRGKVVVLLFTSTRCPIAGEYERRLISLARQYPKHGRVEFFTVNSDPCEAVTEQQLRTRAETSGQIFPTLLDSSSEVAKRFGIGVTPTVLIIDATGVIRYRGAFDNSTDAFKVSKSYCADALRDLLEGRPVASPLTATTGSPVQFVQ